MKKLLQIVIYLLGGMLILSSCGNDEGDPKPSDCIENPIIITLGEVTKPNCNMDEGAIEISATGGTSVLQFSNDGGASFQSNGTFNNLSAGLYTILVRDENDCEATVEATIGEVDGIILNITKNSEAGCKANNGQITISASGGNGNFEYQIDNGAFQSSNVFTALSVGNYAIVVKDDNGCETDNSVDILSGVSFSGAIQNIISTKCAISGCHVSGTGRQNFTQLSTIQSNASGIKSRTQSGNMPKNSSITQEQKDLIACWVDDGALDN